MGRESPAYSDTFGRLKVCIDSQRNTLIQVETLAAYALFQQPFHALRPGNQHIDFGRFLLGQHASARPAERFPHTPSPASEFLLLKIPRVEQTG